MSRFNCVILAAGKGTRLGLPTPKALTELRDGVTLLDLHLRRLREAFGEEVAIYLVVGHRADSFDGFRERVSLVRNERFAETNTAKSLLLALEFVPDGPVLWMNGDVAFRKSVMGEVRSAILGGGGSFMVVNQAVTSDEEVKYVTDRSGLITQVGKEVGGAAGEAIGINYVTRRERTAFTKALGQVDDQDYYEVAVQEVIKSGQASVAPLVIDSSSAIEIDTPSDLNQARLLVQQWSDD